MAFELAFVDGISGTAGNRLNLNDANITTLADGTDFGMPPLERAVVSSMMTDGALVPSAKYGNRIITLALDFPGASKDAIAASLQKVAKELDRPRDPMGQPVNFLRYKAGTTNPIFFRCLRSAISNIVWDSVLSRAAVTILAEPFAYGLRQTLSPVTVNNDPAAGGGNGLFFDITGVLGDVETPLHLSIASAGLLNGLGSATTGRTTCIAVRRRGTPSSAPFVIQAESTSMAIADTTVQANDAAMSGASNNYVRTTFATSAAMTSRFRQNSFPTTSVDARGTYRVFMRYRKSIAGDTIKAQLTFSKNGFNFNGDPVTLAPDTLIHYADLGLVSLPGSTDPVEDALSGALLSVGGAGEFGMSAERTAGSGNLDVDFLALVPADDRLALVTWSLFSGPQDMILDSRRSMAYALGSSGQIRPEQPMSVIGGPPVVSPDATNRITWIRNVNINEGASDDKTATCVITPSYYPRYLYVRPVLT